MSFSCSWGQGARGWETRPARPEGTFSGLSAVPEQKAHRLFNPEVERDHGVGVLKNQEKTHDHLSPFYRGGNKGKEERVHSSKLEGA